jgi:transcriptional regulator with XRE-family HTH domain
MLEGLLNWAEVMRELQGGRTQGALAAELGISQSLVSRLLRGVRQPGPRVIRGIVRARPEVARMVSGAFLGRQV